MPSSHTSGNRLLRGLAIFIVATLAAVQVIVPGSPGHAVEPGTVWSSGKNGDGELGIGTIIPSTTNVPVQAIGLSGATAIAANGYHVQALKPDGSIWAWGSNDFGQLGIGTAVDSPIPVQLSSLTNVVAVGAGGYHSLAIKSDGTAWAWGHNDKGQLGNGSFTSSSTPVQVSGLTGAVAVTGGDSHSLALKSDGTVWAWGRNTFGALGNGTTGGSTVPIQVSGLTGVVAIAAGGAHSLALKSDGSLWAWGRNIYGQVGIGTITDVLRPVQVSSLRGVMAIAAGRYFSLALKSDGTVWAWGNNTYAQLGNGTTADSSIPVRVSGLAGAVAIGSGGWGGLALKPDGSVWVWGRNDYGELGIGTNVNSLTAVQVSSLTGASYVTGGWGHNMVLMGTTYTIAASAGTGGSIAPPGTVTVTNGANQTFTVTPSFGYHTANVLVDGASVGAVASYTFTSVTSNHIIAATFATDSSNYTISASAGTGGSITPSGEVVVNSGDNQTFTITPSADYRIADVLVDGSSVGAVASYTFTDVVLNHTIAASFASTIVNYTITATAGAGGSIEPSGAVVVTGGANQTFTITPATGFSISDVLVDGSSVGAVASYTFTNVASDHTITASFFNPSSQIVNLQITAGADDATENARGVFTLANLLMVSSYSGATPYQRVSTGLRFQNVNIPQGATIITSYLSIYPTDAVQNDPNMKVYLENTANAADFATNPHIIGTAFRPRTTAYSSWVQDNLAINTYVNGPSINAPLQELVNRSDWTAGNDLVVLMIANEDIEKSVRFLHQEQYLHLPPKLHVEFSSEPVPDTTPPVRSNGQPTGTLPAGTTQVTMSLTTNEAATAKYSTVPGTSYASMPNTFSSTGGISHSTLISGLSNGNTYTYYVRTADTTGNNNTDDFIISFSVALPDTTPPVISNVQATGITPSSATITWGTDDLSDSTVNYGTTPSLGLAVSNSSLVTSHAVPLAGLSPSITYYYQVSSRNSDGYSSNSSVQSFATMIAATSIDLQIIAGADDATENARGVFTIGDLLIVRSYPGATPYQRSSTGLRFQNVAIPRGATIITSYLSIYPTDAVQNDANMKVYLENTADAADFVTNPHIIGTSFRPRTTANSSWVQDNLAINTYVNGPSINGPLQELVNRSDWTAGNDLVVLMIANEDIEKSVRFLHQEQYLHLPVKLHIEFTN